MALVVVVAAACAGAAVLARELGSREARRTIAELLGRNSNEIHIKSISPAPVGNRAVVTTQMDVAFELVEREGDWHVASVRLGDGRWEDVEVLRRALDAEKVKRAEADLQALATGVDAFRRERGFYPPLDSVATIVDHVAPGFMPSVIRVDPWNRPYYVETVPGGYRLGSAGPDGVERTADDVTLSRVGEGGAR